MFRQTIEDAKLNLNSGNISFLIHRVTGVGLWLFLYLHILTISSAWGGADSFTKAVEKFDNPIGHAIEYALILCVLLHTVNGIRIIVVDFLGLTGAHKKLLWWSVAAIAAVGACSVPFFFREGVKGLLDKMGL